MLPLLPIGIFLSSFVAYTHANSEFMNPPTPGKPGDYSQVKVTYRVGGTMQIKWNTDLPAVDLYVFQDYPHPSDPKTNYYKRLGGNISGKAFMWYVSLNDLSTDVGPGQSAVLFLALYKPGASGYDAISHYVNVTVPQPPTSTTNTATTGTVTATTTPSASITTPSSETVSLPATILSSDGASSPTDTGTGTGTPQNQNSKSEGLSNGAVAGIAVGATVAGLLLLGGGGLLLWRRLRRGGEQGGQYGQSPQETSPGVDAYKQMGANESGVGTPWTQGEGQPQLPVQLHGSEVYEAP
ncbi:hypothetical protein PT974_05577 [Cladobotryum mycophilum]|uniref:Mid2 domain-containing protein n=1 Tax=Cladobotryum mycophilum TaxID=491253 RepID=A0ABR0SJY1_9HYPO